MNKLENAAFDIDYKKSRVFCGSSKAEVNKTGCLSSSMPSVSLSTVIIPKRIEVPARNIKSVYVSCVRLAWTSAAVCARTWNWNAIICHITLRQKKLATVKIISFIERNRLIYQFWIIYSSRGAMTSALNWWHLFLFRVSFFGIGLHGGGWVRNCGWILALTTIICIKYITYCVHIDLIC